MVASSTRNGLLEDKASAQAEPGKNLIGGEGGGGGLHPFGNGDSMASRGV